MISRMVDNLWCNVDYGVGKQLFIRSKMECVGESFALRQYKGFLFGLSGKIGVDERGCVLPMLLSQEVKVDSVGEIV